MLQYRVRRGGADDLQEEASEELVQGRPPDGKKGRPVHSNYIHIKSSHLNPPPRLVKIRCGKIWI